MQNTDNDENSCPLIGFLTESVCGLYQSNIWIGISDTATQNNYGLICYAGGSLNASSWDPFEPQRNAIYNLVDTNRLRGLIISGSLGSFIAEQEFETFYSKFKNIPVVSIGPEITGVPTVLFDNHSGMRELISHLVMVHQRKHIAFIRGPEGNEEAELRLKIFCDVLRSYNLEISADLIVPGDFSRDAGEKAVEFLVDISRKTFDAVVAANDYMALGALKAFQDRHIKVPDDVLVVGFDDIEECAFALPSLTTVRQPMYEMGVKATELLIDKIEKKDVPKMVLVSAALEVRQSCGCFKFGETVTSDTQKIEKFSLKNLPRYLQHEMEQVLEPMRSRASELISNEEISEFVTIFFNELDGKVSGQISDVIRQFAWRIASAGEDAAGFLRVVAILRSLALIHFSDMIPFHIEDMLQNASLCIADAAARVQAYRRMESEHKWIQLRDAGMAIASAFDLKHLLDVIRNELVELGINNLWLSLYRNPMLSLKEYSCILIMSNGNRVTIEPVFFEKCKIAPDGSIPLCTPGSFLVVPLFFRNEQIGFMTVLVDKCKDGLVYETLRQHISSALKGALLMKKVQEQSLALESANHQLQKLRDAEHAYLEAIKHELELGREIQGSFLPREIPKVNGWEIQFAFSPAREVSGDFYDVFTLPNGHIALVIADVSGKDVSAALFMALIRTLIRSLSEMEHNGESNALSTIALTNKYLINHHYGNNGRYMYATLFMAILDPVLGIVSYINAGHNHPAIIDANGSIRQWVAPSGPAVGIIPDATFEQRKFGLDPGDMLFLYTDGVTEARNSDGTLFSKGKLAEIISCPFASANEIVGKVEKAVNEHCEGLAPHDDITMLVLRREN
jgi:phosphoserine phosphatase RsbU/P